MKYLQNCDDICKDKWSFYYDQETAATTDELKN